MPAVTPKAAHRPGAGPRILNCVHCHSALDGLSRQRGLRYCHAAACRNAEATATLNARWAAVGVAAQRQAQALPGAPAAQAPALVWLRPAERELVPVTDELRERLAKSWRQRATEGWRHAYPGTDSAAALPASAGALCVQCAGRCCAHGGVHDAFIDTDVLQRWQDAHPGSGLEDAIEDYLARLPGMHIKHGCGFQGATGCVLPRESRADICNRYVCSELQAVAEHLSDTPDAAAVVLTRDGRKLERAALLQHGQLTPLTPLPQPDDLALP